RMGAGGQHGFGLFLLLGRERGAGARRLAGFAAGRHAQNLPGPEPVLRLHPPAIDTNLPGACPFRHGAESDLRQVALKPAIEADAIIVMPDGELADLIAQACTRMAVRPMNSAASPPSTD